MLDLYLQLLRRELAERYRGSHLGILWAFITPFAMLLVFTFVFGVMFRARWAADGEFSSTADFALLMFIGLMLYGFLAECMTRTPALIAQRAGYVKHVRFPLWLLPLVVLGSALTQMLIGLTIALVVMLATGRTPSSLLVLLPLVILPLLLFSAGLAWFLAATGVFIKDVQHLMMPLAQMLLFLSPVFYSISMLPEAFRPWMALNPLAWVIDTARGVMVFGNMPSWSAWAGLLAASIVVAWIGRWWFGRAQRGFADVL